MCVREKGVKDRFERRLWVEEKTVGVGDEFWYEG